MKKLFGLLLFCFSCVPVLGAVYPESVMVRSDNQMVSYPTNFWEANALEVNAKQSPYLAKGDGVTDDTVALQAALNSLTNWNRIVHIPAGIYPVTNRLTVPTHLLSSTNYGAGIVYGDGANATTILWKQTAAGTYGATNAVIWAVGDDSTQRTLPKLKGFSVKPAPGAYSIDGVYVWQGGFPTSLEDLYVDGMRTGIRLGRNWHSYLSNCRADNCGRGIVIGLSTDDSNATLNNFTMVGCGAGSNVNTGIWVFDVNAGTITGGAGESNGSSNLEIDSCTGISVNGIYTENSLSFPGGPQIYITGSKGISLNGICVNDVFSSASAPALRVSQSEVSVNGFYVKPASGTSDGAGIWIDGTSTVMANETHIQQMTNGFFVMNTNNLTINNSTFTGVGTPVRWTGTNVDSRLTWLGASRTNVSMSSIDSIPWTISTPEGTAYNQPLNIVPPYFGVAYFFADLNLPFQTVRMTNNVAYELTLNRPISGYYKESTIYFMPTNTAFAFSFVDATTNWTWTTAIPASNVIDRASFLRLRCTGPDETNVVATFEQAN